ncbi:MAG TPA: MASE1 domain-containing protein [Ignavibacteriaceae bacterium]|nr:MASE1 domain-containing protein [Ignavibacteriaceae bacterium]
MVIPKIKLNYRGSLSPSILAKIVVLAAVYFIAGRIGLSLAFINPSASAVWPPTGIAIAAIILWGYNLWPAVFLGALFVNLTITGSAAASLGIAAGNTFEAVLAAYFVEILIKDKYIFYSPVDTVKFSFFVGIIATLISTVTGTVFLFLSGLLKTGSFLYVGLTWWLGDIGGALIIAPFIILLVIDRRLKWNLKKSLEFVLILLLISSISLYTFRDGIPTLTEIFPLIFLTIPFIIWLAVRFSPREISTAILFLYLMTLWQTLSYAKSAEGPSNESLILVQIFMGTLFAAFMPLAADVQQKKVLQNSLQLKINQQKSISELGLSSVSGNNISDIFKDAMRILYETLSVDYIKILKLLPGDKELLLLDGRGWTEELPGNAIIPADADSHAGYTLASKEPVIISDFSKETRFLKPSLFSDDGVKSGISCIVHGKDKPFGVLGAYSRDKKVFSTDDVYFFQSVANIIGMAAERFAYEEQLLSSLREKQILIKEIHHRVKNNLQIISSLLNLQESYINDVKIQQMFRKSKNRINSMALVYKMLHNNEDLSRINFKNYMKELSEAILASFSTQIIECNITSDEVYLEPDQVTNLGLILNEIISNSIKYAFDNSKQGIISIKMSIDGTNAELEVRDNGKGLPEHFDIRSTTTLGMQLITNLTRQVPGELKIENDHGTKYTITFKIK